MIILLTFTAFLIQYGELKIHTDNNTGLILTESLIEQSAINNGPILCVPGSSTKYLKNLQLLI